MAEVFDFMDDESTGDLLIANGDFVVGESTLQHVKDLLITQKGQYRLHPDAGIGIDQFINDDVTNDELASVIQAGIANDNATVSILKVNSVNSIEIVAKYNEQPDSNNIR